MYAQIVIDCQTQTERVICEYCIVNKECLLRTNLDKSKTKEKDEPLTFLTQIPTPITS